MPPQIALLLCILFILFLFIMESKREPKVSKALWIPLIWIMAIGSRPVNSWLSPLGVATTTEVETVYISGSPIDRSIFTILIVTGVFILIRRKIDWSQIFRKNRWIFFLFLYFGVSILWSDYPFVSFKRWIMGIGYFIMALLVLTEANPIEAFKSIFRRYSYAFIPLSIVLIKYYPYLGAAYSHWSGLPEYIGVTTSKNMLGQLCLISGLFFVWDLLSMWKKNISFNKRKALINILFLLLISWLLIKANSATAIMSLIVGICIFTGLSIIRRNVRYLGILILVCIVTFMILMFSFDFIEILLSSLGRDTSLSGRTELWNELMKIGTDPLIGTGFESFWLGDRIRVLWGEYWWLPNQAHNGYIEIYLNLGLIGLFLVIIIIISTLRKIYNVIFYEFDYGRFQMTYLVTFLITNITENIFKGLMWFVFLLIAIDSKYLYPLEKHEHGKIC